MCSEINHLKFVNTVRMFLADFWRFARAVIERGVCPATRANILHVEDDDDEVFLLQRTFKKVKSPQSP
jgi:hypothetical protein